jgi:hypothetical protein
MTEPSPHAAPLALALRIGITGTRAIAPEHRERIARELDGFLAKVRADVLEIARDPAASDPYGPAGSSAPTLKAISPIAEGADRLLAHSALSQGFSLVCPLPFAREEYEKDFTSAESKQEFLSLLQQAGPAVVELDGARGDAENMSYEAVGRYVVRNCDILIAIWNGKPGRGFGGTTDIVRFAINHGPPVFWIHSEQDVAPGWLIDAEDFRQSPRRPPRQGGHLRGYLERLILPPAGHREKPATSFERASHWLKASQTPAYVALAQPQPTSESWIWQPYNWLIDTTAGKVSPVTYSASEPQEPAAAYWFARYKPADGLAAAYARRYRSCYVWTLALGTAALIDAALALAVPGGETLIKLAVTAAELTCLVLIATVVLVNERRSWHRKFLEYRLFAELCRKQQALVLSGWSVRSASQADKSMLFDTGSSHSARHREDNWVVWLFGVLQRAAPPAQGRFDLARVEQVRAHALDHLIDEQLSYHRHRAAQSARADARLGQWAQGLFLAVMACVVAKLVLVAMHAEHGWILALGLAAAILPALSAGFVGIRSYAELSPMADQSRRMETEMAAAKLRVQRIQIDQPLASQALGSELFGVATAMLQDIEGWIQLFGSKIVEPG